MERVTLQESDGRGMNTWERVNGGTCGWPIPLKGLCHEIDFKNFDQSLKNLAY